MRIARIMLGEHERGLRLRVTTGVFQVEEGPERRREPSERVVEHAVSVRRQGTETEAGERVPGRGDYGEDGLAAYKD